MCLRIHIILLLLAVGSYAHTLSKIQITNGSDIYEIIEKPNNMFEIIDPKPKKPILREIIFFKIIETPYHHLKKEKPSQEEGLDFDDTKRPFTNGPGFQFLDYDPKENSTSNSKESNNDSSENDSHDKRDSSDSDRDDGDSDRDREIDDGESSNESKDKKETKSDSNNENNDKVVSSFDIDKKKYKDYENNKSEIKDTDKTDEQSDDKNINEYKDTITSDVSETIAPAATLNKTEKAIQKRNKEFDSAKDKYEEMNKRSNTKSLRRKRDIDFGMPPPPPALPPLNIGMFPDFIQRMITSNPAFRDIVSPDEGVESYNPDESRPGTYGFHLNKDNGHVWNHLPFNNQESYINEPSNMINKEKDEVYSENTPSSDVSNSDSDDNSVNSNDIGYNVGAEEGIEKSTEDDSGVNPPLINFKNFKPYTVTKKKDLSNIKEYEPTQQVTTESNIKYPYENIKEKVPEKIQKISAPPKTKINIDKDLKEKIEMSFDNMGKMVPPLITRFEEKLVKTAIDNNKPLTFGMKLGGDNGYVWNELFNPGNPYFVGEKLDKNKERNGPSSPSTNNLNEYNTEPTPKGIAAANETPNSPLHEGKEITPIVTENKSPEPTTDSKNSNKSNKASLDKEKNNLSSEAVQVALDDLLKKDEFWQWLTKWTAAYIAVLNQGVEELVKREVAKQVNKTMNHQDEEKKDKIYTNNKDLNKNATIANVTAVDTANKTKEAINNTTTEKSAQKTNNTDVKLAPETDKMNKINETASDGHNNNKTSPPNAHTIFGNAIDSDHVTNIFIFYPNANENNATTKEIEKILGKPNNNVVVLGNPSNDNKTPTASDANTNPPVNYTTGIYAIDKKKDTVSNTTELTNKTSESASNIPSKREPTSDSTAKKENSKAAPITNTSVTPEASTSNNTDSNKNTSTNTNQTKASESTNVNKSDATKAVDGSKAAPKTSTSK